MKFHLSAIAAFALFTGCDGGLIDDTGDSGDTSVGGDCTPTGQAFGDDSVAVAWGPSSVSFTITDLPEDAEGVIIGLAETNPLGGGDPVDGWYGEDAFAGTGDYNIEHSFTGCPTVEASLDYVSDPDDVVASETTLFDDSFQAGDALTYLFIVDTGAGDSNDCYVAGDDPSYYSGFGCTTINLN